MALPKILKSPSSSGRSAALFSGKVFSLKEATVAQMTSAQALSQMSF